MPISTSELISKKKCSNQRNIQFPLRRVTWWLVLIVCVNNFLPSNQSSSCNSLVTVCRWLWGVRLVNLLHSDPIAYRSVRKRPSTPRGSLVPFSELLVPSVSTEQETVGRSRWHQDQHNNMIITKKILIPDQLWNHFILCLFNYDL